MVAGHCESFLSRPPPPPNVPPRRLLAFGGLHWSASSCVTATGGVTVLSNKSLLLSSIGSFSSPGPVSGSVPPVGPAVEPRGVDDFPSLPAGEDHGPFGFQRRGGLRGAGQHVHGAGGRRLPAQDNDTDVSPSRGETEAFSSSRSLNSVISLKLSDCFFECAEATTS